MTQDVKRIQAELENKYIRNKDAVDKAALEMYGENPLQAQAFLTDYSVSMSDNTFKRWQELSQFLLVKYMDGNIKKEVDGKFQYNGMGGRVPAYPDQPGYPDWWYEKIVEKTGDKLKVLGESH